MHDHELLTIGRERLDARPSNLGLSSDSVAYRTHAPVVSIHRDSDALARSNYSVILRDLEERHGSTVSAHDHGCVAHPHSTYGYIGRELDCRCAPDVTVERFRDWAFGWTEHVLVRVERPTRWVELDAPTDAWRSAVEWLEALRDYPVADEEHYSMLETEELEEWVASELDGHDGPWTEAILEELYSGSWDTSVESVDVERVAHVVWSARATSLLGRGRAFLLLREAGNGQLTMDGGIVTVPDAPSPEDVDALLDPDGIPWRYVSTFVGSDTFEELEDLRTSLAGVLAYA